MEDSYREHYSSWMMIRCFVDESYSGNQRSGLFTLTWLCVRPEVLGWFELAWKNVLDKTNARLGRQGRPPIRRFHATELNGGTGVDLPELREMSGNVGENLDRLISLIEKQGIALNYTEKIAPALGMSYGGRIAILPGQSKAGYRQRRLSRHGRSREKAAYSHRRSALLTRHGLCCRR